MNFLTNFFYKRLFNFPEAFKKSNYKITIFTGLQDWSKSEKREAQHLNNMKVKLVKHIHGSDSCNVPFQAYVQLVQFQIVFNSKMFQWSLPFLLKSMNPPIDNVPIFQEP